MGQNSAKKLLLLLKKWQGSVLKKGAGSRVRSSVLCPSKKKTTQSALSKHQKTGLAKNNKTFSLVYP
jgi:hypothetical protein